MPVLSLKNIGGIGGMINLSQSIHCHLQPFGKNENRYEKKDDNLFFRHLTIFLLDKFFRLTKHYHERHIPMPLGYAYDSDNVSPIGIISEFVYGVETSYFYNEHLEWDSAANAFAQFGFDGLDYDLFSGFSGEADSLSHNFFSQDDLFPLEQQKVFDAPSDKSWLKDRYSTAHWMRIDFAESSFPFRAEQFLKEFDKQKELLKKFLTKDEFYFLTQYVLIHSNKGIEDPKQLAASVLAIRQNSENLKEVYALQKLLHQETVSSIGFFSAVKSKDDKKAILETKPLELR